jgi:hypothetical protein
MSIVDSMRSHRSHAGPLIHDPCLAIGCATPVAVHAQDEKKKGRGFRRAPGLTPLLVFLTYRWSMILSENRFPLFGIML